MRIEVPLLIYGKEHGQSPLPKPYAILNPTTGGNQTSVYQAATRALVAIGQAFAWRPHPPGVDRHQPCYGIWSLPGQPRAAIVFCILDDGCDDRGRPRTIRIEAGVISQREVLDDANLLSTAARPAAWAERINKDAALVELSLGTDGEAPVK